MIVRAWLGVGVVGSTLLLTGCAQINKVFDNEKGGSYKRSGSISALDLPPDLTAPQYDSTFAVNNNGGPISARTAGTGTGVSANVLPESVDMAFKGQGTNRYLEVDLPAGQLWQKIQDFWTSNDIKLRRNEAQIGVMETAWVEKKGDLPRGTIQKLLGSFLKNINDMGIRDRYTLRLERAGKKTNIYMAHRGAEQVVSDFGSAWEKRPADPEKAAEMLNRLQAYLQENARKTKPVPKTNVVKQPIRNTPAKPTVTRATVVPPQTKPSTSTTLNTPLTIKPTLNDSVALSTTGRLGADVVNLPKRKAAPPPPPPVTKRPPIVRAAASDDDAAEKVTKEEVVSKPAAKPQATAKLAFLSTTNDGQPALGVRQSAKKTFAKIDSILKKSGFAIDGKNAKNGLYAIRYTGNKGVVKKGSKQILHIIEIGKVSAMRLLDINGKPLNANKAKKILRSIESGFNRS